MQLFLVGGAVRDLMLGKQSRDWDFTAVISPADTRLDPFSAMVDVLTNALDFEVFVASPEHLTVRARAPKGWTFAGMQPPVSTFDFVLARKDVSTDGRRATVEPGTLFDDLARRDFTINALAMDSEGVVSDPFNGTADIASGIIRTVGDPADRFSEDGLRVLRALRFAATLGFDIDTATEAAMSVEFIGANVSTERIREELHKAFAADTQRAFELVGSIPGLWNLLDRRGVWFMPTTKTK